LSADPGLERVFARSPRMVSRRIAGECVLVPLAARGADLDSIYNLNAVGAFIWERLDGQTPGETIVGALTASFEVDSETATRDFSAFVETLQSLGALEPVVPA
jgi:hypothetical protein